MAFSHDFDPTVLREYDIRGIVGSTLHPVDAFAIGRCFGSMVANSATAGAGAAQVAATTVMVTGSHNPPNYNGFKMTLGGKPFFGAQILALGDMAAAGNVVPQAGGKVETVDVSAEYIARLLADYDGTRPLSVVWDNGNGAAGDVLTRLVAGLPGTHRILFGAI